MGSTWSHLKKTVTLLCQFAFYSFYLLLALFPCVKLTGRALTSAPEGKGLKILKRGATLAEITGHARAYVQGLPVSYQDTAFKRPSRWKGRTVSWHRAREISAIGASTSSNEAMLFGEGTGEGGGQPSPQDVKQGLLGTCYLLCALSVLAEDPVRVRRLYAGSNADGSAHAVCFFHRGQWAYTVVDDYFPVLPAHSKKKNDGAGGRADLACCSSWVHKGRLWPNILEKAFAKMFGNDNYLNIEGGQPSFALHSLTGLPAQRYDVKSYPADQVWEKLSLAKGTQAVVTASVDTLPLFGSIFPCGSLEAVVNSCFRCCVARNGARARLLFAWFNTAWRLVSALLMLPFYLIPGLGDCLVLSFNLMFTGLVAGHAYAVLEAVEYHSYLGCASKRLVKIRNPWADGAEWKRAWSDNSCCWKLHPGAKKQCELIEAEDGTFWMSLSDFMVYFDTVSVTTVHTESNAIEMGEERGGGREGKGDVGLGGALLTSESYFCQMDDAKEAGCTFTVPLLAEGGGGGEMDNAVGKEAIGVWVATHGDGEHDHNGQIEDQRHCLQVWGPLPGGRMQSKDAAGAGEERGGAAGAGGGAELVLVGHSPMPILCEHLDPIHNQFLPLASQSTPKMLLDRGKTYRISVQYLDLNGPLNIGVTVASESQVPITLL